MSLFILFFFQPFYLSEADVADERGKFIEDARRLAEDVSNNQTFNTVQPLLNFWAGFSPSKEVSFCSLINIPMVLSKYKLPTVNRVGLASAVFLKSKVQLYIKIFEPTLNLFWSRCFSTPFGLYRDGTELRGVECSKPEVAKAACDSVGNKCNYPILLGILAPPEIKL